MTRLAGNFSSWLVTRRAFESEAGRGGSPPIPPISLWRGNSKTKTLFFQDWVTLLVYNSPATTKNTKSGPTVPQTPIAGKHLMIQDALNEAYFAEEALDVLWQTGLGADSPEAFSPQDIARKAIIGILQRLEHLFQVCGVSVGPVPKSTQKPLALDKLMLVLYPEVSSAPEGFRRLATVLADLKADPTKRVRGAIQEMMGSQGGQESRVVT